MRYIDLIAVVLCLASWYVVAYARAMPWIVVVLFASSYYLAIRVLCMLVGTL